MGQPQNIEEITKLNYPEISEVGRIAFELAELKYLGIPTRQGFVIKTYFLKDFLQQTGIYEDIEKIKSSPHSESEEFTRKAYESVRKKIIHTPIPERMVYELHGFYRRLMGGLWEKPVDIFSSGKSDKSEIYSNVLGDANVLIKIKSIWAANLHSLIAVVVVKNLDFDITGKVFTNKTVSDGRLTKHMQDKLASYCKSLEKHFYFPKEIDFGVKNNEVYVTNIKPFTDKVDSNARKRSPLVSGITVNPGIVTGTAKILSKNRINEMVRRNQVLIVPELSNTFYKKIKDAKAVIADGHLLNAREKAIYKRNFRFVTIEGAKNATRVFKDGNIVTVDGTTGNAYLGGIT